MPETLIGQGISIGQRNYAVFKVQPTYGGQQYLPSPYPTGAQRSPL